MIRRVASQDLVIRIPCKRASYSASLLEALSKLTWRMYFSFSPLGEISSTPAPAPCFLFDPSKNIFQEFERSGGLGVCASIHSTRKSRRIWALIAVGCQN